MDSVPSTLEVTHLHAHSTHSGRSSKFCSLRSIGPLALLILFTAGCDREELLRVNTEKEANRILVELACNDVPDARAESSTDHKGQVQITVGYADLNKAREVLTRLNLPREQTGGFDEMLSQTSLIPSAADDRAKMIRATTGELEKTFQTYDGVVEARVHIVVADHDSMQLQPTTKPSSAMVLIKYRTGIDPLKDENNTLPTTKEAQNMIARSVEGVRADDVEVHFTEALKREPKNMPDQPWYLQTAVQSALAGTGIGIILTLMAIATYRATARHKPATAELTATAANRSVGR